MVRDGWWRLQIELGLSEITPYRIFTLDAPRRLVVDFQDVDWQGVAASDLLKPGRALDVRFGNLRPGWSRMVVDLAEPMAVSSAGMVTVPQGADLSIVLRRVSAARYAAAAGAPPGDPEDYTPAPRPAPIDDRFVVMIDPGHGGIDPGAGRDGVAEAALMLALAQEVAEALVGDENLNLLLTRDSDAFVPLDGRISLARAAGADLLVSLHADALAQDDAQGASVYTLAVGGGDAASARMVTHHDRADILAGVDLTGQGDRVANVLMEMARRDTGRDAKRFADVLVRQMRARGVDLNTRPRREAQLAVLAAADFPSVLLEAGFLSNDRDRDRLSNAAGRAPLVQAIVAAVRAWAAR